ncbi:MAG: CotH kinase family protein [Planctomycetes bacterium]|nr:CotH kinase family protein [Planctomycetota bacterium]
MKVQKKRAWIWGVFSLLACVCSWTDANVIISEFMAGNRGSFADGDREFSDWIEIFNAGGAAVDLAGWHLTDDPANLKKWTFPGERLEPGQFLVVFASGKDDELPDGRDLEGYLHTNFRLDADGGYLALVQPDGANVASEFGPAGIPYPPQEVDRSYGFEGNVFQVLLVPEFYPARILVPASSLGLNWTQVNFDPAGWIDGMTGVGYERSTGYEALIKTDVGAQMYNLNSTVYLRLTFTVDNPLALSALTLRMKYDDGFIAYLNGVRIAASNAPAAPNFRSVATAENPEENAVRFEDFEISEFMGALRPGLNVLAIHGLNWSLTSSDLLVLPELFGSRFSVKVDPAAARFLLQPTPGLANSSGYPALAAPPRFSIPGGTFLESGGAVAVMLTSPSPTVQIRYTLNGSDPTPSSALYTGPISLSSSATLRARAFDAGVGPSRLVTENYLLVARDLEGFNSNLPVVIIDSLGTPIPGTLTQDFAPAVAAFIDTSETSGRATIADSPEFLGRAGLRVRGNSAASYPKLPYRLEIWDDYGDDLEVSLLGMPDESDWILEASWADRTLMRNMLMYRLWRESGHYSPGTRAVEVYLNTGGGKVSNADYWGVYIFTERIKRDGDRVDLQKLFPSHNREPEISGGYILQDDRRQFGEQGITTAAGPAGTFFGIIFEDPEEDELTPQQIAWVQNYFNRFEAALEGPAFRDPAAGYAKYIDVPSWIDYHLLTEAGANPEAFQNSVYMSIDRGGKIVMGPLWDYAGGLGGSQEQRFRNPEVFMHDILLPNNDPYPYPWWPRLFEDPEFELKWMDRWQELRRGALATDRLLSIIDQYTAELAEAQARNFARWPASPKFFPTWQGHIDYLKQYIRQRFEWFDSHFLPAPRFNQNGGTVPPGFQVTIAATQGTIFYTLDGSDPRPPGGAAPTNTALINSETPVNVLIPDAADEAAYGAAWRGSDEASFQAAGGLAGWTSGTGSGVGFDITGALLPSVATNVQAAMHGGNASAYMRIPFQVTNPSMSELTMSITYDDGFVAYLNGVEVARRCAPPALAFDSSAASCSGSFEVDPVLDFDAASGVTASGGVVDSWAARAGNVTATPFGGISTRRPAWEENVFSGGQPGIHFDGFNDTLAFSDAALPAGTSPFTMAIVFRFDQIDKPIQPNLFSWGNDAENQLQEAGMGKDSSAAGHDLVYRLNGANVSSNLAIAANQNTIGIIVRLDGSHFTFDLVADGLVRSAAASIAPDFPAVVRERGRIGNSDPDNPDRFAASAFDGYVGRILVFDRALDRSERLGLIQLLSSYITLQTLQSSPNHESIPLTQHLKHLQKGANLLAIHGLNLSPEDGDFLILPELQATSVGSPAAILYSGEPIVITESVRVRARSLINGEWSGLAEAIFSVEMPIRITEIMYHPLDSRPDEIAAGFADDDDFEFIEATNLSPTAPVDLDGVRFVQGIQHTFGHLILAPGQSAVLIRNQEAFQLRYGRDISLAGQYGGTPDDIKLSNGGELITLVDRAGGVIQSFRYEDEWYPATDGQGYSLEIADDAGTPEDWSRKEAWRQSRSLHGSPGHSIGGPSGGLQLSGDINQDAELDISDSIGILGHLFLSSPAVLPCEGGTALDSGNSALLDLNGDGVVDLTDAIHLLSYLFLGELPPVLGKTCVPIAGCPSVCKF